MIFVFHIQSPRYSVTLNYYKYRFSVGFKIVRIFKAVLYIQSLLFFKEAGHSLSAILDCATRLLVIEAGKQSLALDPRLSAILES